MFEIKVVFNNEVYLRVKDVKEKLGVSIARIKTECETTKLQGMGNTLYIKESELSNLGTDQKTIVFHVQSKLAENIKSSVKMGGLVSALFGMPMSEEELIEKAIKDSGNEINKTLEQIKKKHNEFKDRQDEISKLNEGLEAVGSKLFFKHYITIDKKLHVKNDIYLCGNSVYKDVDYYFNNIAIPAIGHYPKWWSECNDEEVTESLDINKLYVFEDDENITIDLKSDIDCDIDYSKSHLDISYQLIENQNLKVYQDCNDYVDFENEDGSIDFDITTDDVVDAMLIEKGKNRVDRWDMKYYISLEQLDKLAKQLV